MALSVGFREHLGSVLLCQEELDSSFQIALTLAATNEDLAKLNTIVIKVEKVLEDLRKEIGQKMSPNSFSIATQPIPAATMPQLKPSVSDVQAQQSTSPHVKPTEPIIKSLSQPQLNASQERSEHINGHHYQAFHNPSSTIFTKMTINNPSIPDSQRVFLDHLNTRTTEESLYQYFSQFGFVVDVNLSTYTDGRYPTAVVGFGSPDVVQRILPLTFAIDDVEVKGIAYANREEAQQRNYQTRPQSQSVATKEKRYQVFLGGIPSRAKAVDVLAVLEDYGTVREIRMKQRVEAPHLHRGFAHVDFESDAGANRLIQRGFLSIFGKRVEAKCNVKSAYAILHEDAEPSSSGSNPVHHLVLEPHPPVPLIYHQTSPPHNVLKSTAMPNHTKDSSLGKDEKEVCMICRKNPKNCVVLWCGHAETCGDCGAKLDNCPKKGCGKMITKFQMVDH